MDGDKIASMYRDITIKQTKTYKYYNIVVRIGRNIRRLHNIACCVVIKAPGFEGANAKVPPDITLPSLFLG